MLNYFLNFSEWSPWTEWSGCYSLINGAQQRRRLCQGGSSCQGRNFEERECLSSAKLVRKKFAITKCCQKEILFCHRVMHLCFYFLRCKTISFLSWEISGVSGVIGQSAQDPAMVAPPKEIERAKVF